MIIEVFTPRNVTLRTQKTWEEVEICDPAKLRLMKGQSDFTEDVLQERNQSQPGKGSCGPRLGLGPVRWASER